MPSFRQARGAGSSLGADMMSTFALGQMLVRRSGYGAMQLAGPYAFGPPPDRALAIGVLRAAVAAGVDHIDTAQYYGPGVVNDLIREALHPYSDGLAIVSKVAVRRDDDGAVLPFDDPDQLCEGTAARDEGLIAGVWPEPFAMWWRVLRRRDVPRGAVRLCLVRRPLRRGSGDRPGRRGGRPG